MDRAGGPPLTPSGTVTFLFTDIEGSAPLWDSFPDAMGAALARHDEIVRGGDRRERWPCVLDGR